MNGYELRNRLPRRTVTSKWPRDARLAAALRLYRTPWPALLVLQRGNRGAICDEMLNA